jgi:hypothetical protein
MRAYALPRQKTGLFLLPRQASWQTALAQVIRPTRRTLPGQKFALLRCSLLGRHFTLPLVTPGLKPLPWQKILPWQENLQPWRRWRPPSTRALPRQRPLP